MRVAVTGSSGLIGSALVDRLTTRGHEVLRIVRPSTDATNGDTVTWDPGAGTIDTAGLEGVDAVVHLAGAGIGDRRWSEERKHQIIDSRSRGTALISEALATLTRRPAVLLSGSAIGFYGDRGDEVLDERAGPGTGFLTEVCTHWEAATGMAEAAGIRVVHLRTGLVLAPKGGALGKMLPLFRFGLGGRMGKGRQWWSWISLDDELGAIEFLLENEVAGPVNLTAPSPVTNAEFTRALGRALHRPAVIPVPRFGPGLLLGRELAGELLFFSQRVRPQVLEEAGYKFRHPDLPDALQSLLPP